MKSREKIPKRRRQTDTQIIRKHSNDSDEPQAAPPFRAPRGCWWTSLLLGGLSIFIGGLSLLTIPRMWMRSQEVWTEAEGVVVEPYLETGTRRGARPNSSTTTYDVRLKYRYSIADQEYTGDAAAVRQPDDDEVYQEAKALLRSYSTGDRLAIFHHPVHVDRSRLTAKEPRQKFVFDTGVALVFFLGGFGLIAFGRWIVSPPASNEDNIL